MILSFDDSKKPGEIKKIIEENRNIAWNTEIKLITKFFDGVLSDWEKEKI